MEITVVTNYLLMQETISEKQPLQLVSFCILQAWNQALSMGASKLGSQ